MRMKATFRWTMTAAAALAILATGCSSLSVYSITYLGVPPATATDPMRVEILQQEPQRPFERLGEIVVDASLNPPPPPAKIEQRMRKDAAKMGADAVFLVQDRAQQTGWWWSGPWWSPSVNAMQTRVIVGIAIRYKADK